jgi:hypothetical protein
MIFFPSSTHHFRTELRNFGRGGMESGGANRTRQMQIAKNIKSPIWKSTDFREESKPLIANSIKPAITK